MSKLKHVGFSSHRLIYNPVEKLFVTHWRKEVERGLLKNLIEDPITQRDASVAATIVQWLGSEVGSGFLLDVYIESPEFRERLTGKRE